MKIFINSKSTRRTVFTDRSGGYLELSYNNNSNGYFRGDTRFLKDFSLNGKLYTEEEHTVSPFGFTFNNKYCQLDVSLLIDEKAFYVKAKGNFTLHQLVESKQVTIEDKSTGQIRNEFSPVVNQQWKKTGFILSDENGIAVISDTDFDFKISNSDLTITPSLEVQNFYVTFEKNSIEAEKKARTLCNTKAIEKHIQKINLFLNKSSIKSGIKELDDSFMWAKFSAWLLASKDSTNSPRGIWAGLPWFRDNWGRDTFISLNGTSLSTGCFDEAKEILRGFAGFQDLNKNSATFGRIPNRYRNIDDVIYNTVDGTLWFIRGVWEYVNYTGDTAFFDELLTTIETALDADIQRCDENGFLCHDDADTWMDARIQGKEPWSPRGNRANDIQCLWYTALIIGSKIEERANKIEKANQYRNFARLVKESFEKYFWDGQKHILADRIDKDGVQDYKCRPNQLFDISACTNILENLEFLKSTTEDFILDNVKKEIAGPFGLYSLSPEEKTFHPHHEWPEYYHKDAAYHNGTIWPWNTGSFITADTKNKFQCSDMTTAILMNYSKMILEWGATGTLSENIHAITDTGNNPILSGTYSQCWSVAEFVRNITQDITGFVPLLSENKIQLSPCLPKGINEWHATLPFGKNCSISIEIEKTEDSYECRILWTGNSDFTEIVINGVKVYKDTATKLSVRYSFSQTVPLLNFSYPKKLETSPFTEKNLCPPWNGPSHEYNYLEKLILGK